MAGWNIDCALQRMLASDALMLRCQPYKKSLHPTSVLQGFTVRLLRAGVEPARVAPLVFETSASTDSAIGALRVHTQTFSCSSKRQSRLFSLTSHFRRCDAIPRKHIPYGYTQNTREYSFLGIACISSRPYFCIRKHDRQCPQQVISQKAAAGPYRPYLQR